MWIDWQAWEQKRLRIGVNDLKVDMRYFQRCSLVGIVPWTWHKVPLCCGRDFSWRNLLYHFLSSFLYLLVIELFPCYAQGCQFCLLRLLLCSWKSSFWRWFQVTARKEKLKVDRLGQQVDGNFCSANVLRAFSLLFSLSGWSVSLILWSVSHYYQLCSPFLGYLKLYLAM